MTERGDIVWCTSHTLVGAAIRYAQRRDGEADWDVNHIAIVNEAVEGTTDFTVIQAETHGVTSNKLLSTITPLGRHLVIPFPDDRADRERFMAMVSSKVGDHYSWLSVASAAFDMVLPDAVDLRRGGTFDCSGLAAYGLLYAGFAPLTNVPDIYTVTPARLATLLRS